MWKYWTGSCAQKDSIGQQVHCLLEQLLYEKQGDRIIKVTFFVACETASDYREKLANLEIACRQVFSYPLLITLVPQAPIEHDLYLEAWYLPSGIEATINFECRGDLRLLRISGADELMIVHTHTLTGNVENDARSCFSLLQKLIDRESLSFDHLFRQWNYIGNILQQEDGKQNYQQFNEVRSGFFAGSNFPAGYPAATGIGMDIPGVIIEACFLNSDQLKPVGITSPIQLSAHSYSEKVLVSLLTRKSTPKFERAKALVNHQSSTIFISGTAAILGEASSPSGSYEEQTGQTIDAIHQLVSLENLVLYACINPASKIKYHNVRVYLKNGYLSDSIREQVEKYFSYHHALFLKADVCRDELLVEIEAELKIN